MNKRHFKLFAILLLSGIHSTTSLSQDHTKIKIDPMLLVSLKECRNITNSLGNQLFTDWHFEQTPVLFYRPKVQDVLINFPLKPSGFSDYTGFNPLDNENIYYRDDTTLFSIDDQNTFRDIEGIPVLVVADPFSSMRNQLVDVLTRPKDWVDRWLDEWNFIPSPYKQIQLILHEGFHIYQNKMAPGKHANEMVVTQYPLLDPINNSLYVLEGNLLRDALLNDDSEIQLSKIRQFVAVRSYRQSRLDSAFVEYENLNEFLEGLAKYIEYKFLQSGESIVPVKEMYYHQGFNGYKGILSEKFREALTNMVNIVAVNDDRFGNKFGSGPLRFKLYDLGACQALLLDVVMPQWKAEIFQDTLFLFNLLKKAVPLTLSESEKFLAQAKVDYSYDNIFENKLLFEQEGKKQIQQKLSAIMDTKQTVVKIFYGGITERFGMAYTPFGVTQITSKSAIYDMVPIKIKFKEGVTLEMQQVIPVLVDREKMMIVFSIQTPVSQVQPNDEGKLETMEFFLSSNSFELTRQNNTIEIKLK